jgi:hypothetical protein
MLRDEWYNRTQTKPSSSEVIVREENSRGSDYNAYLSKVFGGLDNIKISYSGGSSSKIVVVGSNEDSDFDEPKTKSASTVDSKLKSLFAVSPVRPTVSRSHSIREIDQPANLENSARDKTKIKDKSDDLSKYIVEYEMEGGNDGNDENDKPDESLVLSFDEPEEEPEEDLLIETEEEPAKIEDESDNTKITDFIKTEESSPDKSEDFETINEFIEGGEEIYQPDCDLLENKEVALDSEDNIV